MSAPLLMFSKLNPLDNAPVQRILGCEILGDVVHFKVLDEQGKPYLKKVAKTQFVMTQISQFSIPIDSNV